MDILTSSRRVRMAGIQVGPIGDRVRAREEVRKLLCLRRNIMLPSNGRSASATHPLKICWISREDFGHCIHQGFNSPSRNQPAIDAWLDQLGVRRDISADDWTAKCQCLQKDSGQVLRQSWAVQAPSGEKFLTVPLHCSGNR